MTSRDLVKEQRPLYRATAEPSLVDVPRFTFLQSTGAGSPEGSEFATAMGGLYAVAYTLRFQARAEGVVDYKVPPLEGLWWADDFAAFERDEKRDWKWTVMLRVPDEIDAASVDRARDKARKKAGEAVDAVQLEAFDEGRVAQIMHIGPFENERPTIQRLHAFIRDQGLEFRGAHHEIYMGDPRRTAPDRLRTILRQPVS